MKSSTAFWLLVVLFAPGAASAADCGQGVGTVSCNIQVNQAGRYSAQVTANQHTNIRNKQGSAWVDLLIDGQRCGERKQISCDNCQPVLKNGCIVELSPGGHIFSAREGNQWMDADQILLDVERQ
jgi:hypothetical protein